MPDRPFTIDHLVTRPCPYCETAGCEECDGRGVRYRASIKGPDGAWVTIAGSGVGPNADAVEALEGIARAAIAQRLELPEATADA